MAKLKSGTGTTKKVKESFSPTTTATAPDGTEGDLYYDSTLDALMAYGQSWKQVSRASASGGTKSLDGSYSVHTFTGDGTFTVTGGTLTADLLVVGAGGGGARRHGGGAGGGGVVYKQNHEFASGDHAIDIGAGGSGSTNPTGASGTAGQDSTIASTAFVAKGGGMGACDSAFHGPTANQGGCGGGSDDETTHGGETIQDNVGGDSSTYGFGQRGGGGSWDSLSGSSTGKGGGGSYQQGQQHNGGDGVQEGTSIVYGATVGGTGSGSVTFDINGTDNYYGGGGGGGQWVGHTAAGTGGNGGGGAGATAGQNNAVAGGTNTGGGGGSNGNDDYNGAAGGSGIVVIRYQV